MDLDLQIRNAAFGWLKDQTMIRGDVLPRELLRTGFEFQGEQIPLVSPQGIFKPRMLDVPLSITTSPNSPYDDSFDEKGFLSYRYRGSDSNHRDNVGLRSAFKKRLPLIYLRGIVPGQYLAVWPVYVVADNPAGLSFQVAVDDMASVNSAAVSSRVAESEDAKRAYLTAAVRIRMHQRGFREKVLDAYHSRCAFCQLRHRELLDAAHIIPDQEPGSRPIVENGLSLCKLHHAAFDSLFLGVSPDFKIHVRQDILEEEDGPVLQHGLKGLNGSSLILPSSKDLYPGKEFLDWRFERFKRA